MKIRWIALLLVICPGCEITASVFVEKDWRTDERLYASPDMKTRAEIKASRIVGEKTPTTEKSK